MSQQNYDSQNDVLNQEALMSALDEISKESKELDTQAVNKIKGSFNKSYDPYTPLEKIAPVIDEADKYSDMSALGLGGIFFSLALFFFFIMFAQYSDFFSVLVVFGFVACMIGTTWLLGYSSKKGRAAQKELTNLRLTYFDKSMVTKLFEERSKKSKVGGIILFASIFLGVMSLVLTAMTIFGDLALVPFFILFGIGMFISARTSARTQTLKRLLDTTQK